MNSPPKKRTQSSLPDFHARMWDAFCQNAVGLTGPQVVAALRRASDLVYEAGIDTAYAGLPLDETLALAFDLTWLTAVNIELKKVKS